MQVLAMRQRQRRNESTQQLLIDDGGTNPGFSQPEQEGADPENANPEAVAKKSNDSMRGVADEGGASASYSETRTREQFLGDAVEVVKEQEGIL